MGDGLTVFGHHGEGDRVAGVLDELHDVIVRQLHDGLAVDGRDAVADSHPAQAVGGASLDDAADLVRDDCNAGQLVLISLYYIHLYTYYICILGNQ